MKCILDRNIKVCSWWCVCDNLWNIIYGWKVEFEKCTYSESFSSTHHPWAEPELMKIYRHNAHERQTAMSSNEETNLYLHVIPVTNLSRKSVRKRYPWHVRKSSSNNCETSLESFRKQKTVTNISTSSIGDSSWTRCMLSVHIPTQPLPENRGQT